MVRISFYINPMRLVTEFAKAQAYASYTEIHKKYSTKNCFFTREISKKIKKRKTRM